MNKQSHRRQQHQNLTVSHITMYFFKCVCCFIHTAIHLNYLILSAIRCYIEMSGGCIGLTEMPWSFFVSLISLTNERTKALHETYHQFFTISWVHIFSYVTSMKCLWEALDKRVFCFDIRFNQFHLFVINHVQSIQMWPQGGRRRVYVDDTNDGQIRLKKNASCCRWISQTIDRGFSTRFIALSLSLVAFSIFLSLSFCS